MKKIFLFVLIVILLLVSYTPANCLSRDELAISVFIDDEKQDLRVFASESSDNDFYLDSYIPLIAVLERMNLNVKKASADLLYITGENRCNIKIEIMTSSIRYTKFLDETFGKHYNTNNIDLYLKDGVVYLPLSKIAIMLAGFTNQKNNNIYLYTSKYYYSKYVIDNKAGHSVDMAVYVNNDEVTTTVYRNLSSSAFNGNNLSDYVALIPIFEKLGAKVDLTRSDTVYITSKTLGNYKIIIGKNIYKYKDSSFDNNSLDITYDCHDTFLFNGNVYIPFSEIRYLIDGSLKQIDDKSMYLFSSDFERTDIPATLEECYAALDKELSQKIKDEIRSSLIEDLYNYHFSIGLWIRNNWLITDSRITKALHSKGYKEIDSMSSLIIEGYYFYLNGKTFQLDSMTNNTVNDNIANNKLSLLKRLNNPYLYIGFILLFALIFMIKIICKNRKPNIFNH